jgi:hypothetical protein
MTVSSLQSGSKDDSDTESQIDYPLSGAVSDPSLDATSVGENGDRVRPEKLEHVTDEDKSEALRLKSEANRRFGGTSDFFGLPGVREAKSFTRGAPYQFRKSPVLFLPFQHPNTGLPSTFTRLLSIGIRLIPRFGVTVSEIKFIGHGTWLMFNQVPLAI